MGFEVTVEKISYNGKCEKKKSGAGKLYKNEEEGGDSVMFACASEG